MACSRIGASGSANFAIAVNNPIPAGTTQIANSATISDATVAVAATGSAITPVTVAPRLGLTKRAGAASITPGGTVARLGAKLCAGSADPAQGPKLMRLAEHASKVALFAFDLLELEGEPVISQPWSRRRELLGELIVPGAPILA